VVPDGAPGKRSPVPHGARLSLEASKPRYLLGECILLQFGVRNAGSTTFTLDSADESAAAGDGNAPRDPRYRVSVTAADGAQVPPRPRYPDRGLSLTAGTVDLEPGQTFYETLPLARYARVDRPGEYTVRVHHNLGWDCTKADLARAADAASVKISVRMPTAPEARQIVSDYRRLYAQIAEAEGPATLEGNDFEPPETIGQKRAAWPDFLGLRYPVYLAPLADAARGGFVPAVRGIAMIETPEATTALIDLLDSADPAVATAALYALQARLPGEGGGGTSRHHTYTISGPSMAAEADELDWWRRVVRDAWRPEFATRLRDWSKAQLRDELRRAVSPLRRWCAAELLRDLGQPEDLPDVMAALEHEMAAPGESPVRVEQTYGGDAALVRVAGTLLRRGAKLPAEPKRTADIVVYLNEVYDGRAARLPDWDRHLQGWLRHASPYVRAQATVCLPRAPKPPLLDLLPALATDRDPLVQLYFLSWIRADHVVAARRVVERMRDAALDPRVRRDVDATLDALQPKPSDGQQN
jgi:HEAT repeat protein